MYFLKSQTTHDAVPNLLPQDPQGGQWSNKLVSRTFPCEIIGSYISTYTTTRVLISPWPDQEGNKLGSMSGTCEISTSRHELSSSFFFFLQVKAPKEIHAILTEILACFLPGQAKDLSTPLYAQAPR